jgi:3',5'-cyclic AMP phosphodiesterase CpdA
VADLKKGKGRGALRCLVILLSSLVLISAIYLITRRYPVPEKPPLQFKNFQSQAIIQRPFLIIGDTQRSSLIEQWGLGREDNEDATKALFRYIDKEDAQFMVLLGDMVFDGASRQHWAEFDLLLDPIYQKGLPLLPVLGNHEYWGINQWAKENIDPRFSALKKQSWYDRRYGPLSLIILNSNLSELSVDIQKQQRDWYQQKIKNIEADGTLKGFLVFTHHPPYTNAEAVSDDKEVQEQFLPMLQASKKGLALLSGHAHGYEHFKKQGKHFIISAGGGGPRSPRKSAAEREHKDLFDGLDPRPFHYLKVTVTGEGLTVQVKGFYKEDKSLRALDSFELPF